MSIKEAISWLEGLTWHEGEDVPIYDTDVEAINMAIKALEQEPTTKNDAVDAISRAQALKELKESAEHHANDSREEVLLRRDRDIIRALPPVTPREPRKGRWIIDGHHRRCPECDEYFCTKDAEGNEIPSSFCPNCGTDTRGVQE